jgi:hypothetical protein
MHVKAPVVRTAVQEAVVVVTNKKSQLTKVDFIMRCFAFCALLFFIVQASLVKATVLPDERVDTLGHLYDGGGIQISGPSILVRKNIGSAVSVSGHYYADMVSSASIDVQYSKSAKDLVSGASSYSEERVEKSLSLDYIIDRTTFAVGYTSSDENDYHAKTYNFGVNQAFFGDLTTLSFGFGLGSDLVGKNLKNGEPDPLFRVMDKERRKYTFALSQIMTKNLLVDLSVDAGSDHCLRLREGESCLNNPQRQVRYVAPGERGFDFQAEKYPLTHNTDAVGLRAIYHLPYKATVRGDIRKFTDSWGLKAKNAEIRYNHELDDQYLLEVKYRVYSQTGADFYSDLFNYKNEKTFLARDKELSPFSSTSIGVGVTYKMPWRIPGVERSTANFYWDHIQINYDDFRDYNNFMNKGGFKDGDESLYQLDADVIRLYFSFWY